MKSKIILSVIVLIILGCGSSQETKQLSGPFKYLSYTIDSSGDNYKFKLLHFLSINKNGSYKLIQRVSDDSTAYYYGNISNNDIDGLNNFSKQNFTKNYKGKGEVVYKFDYDLNNDRKQIIFNENTAPAQVIETKKMLDKLLTSPDKKRDRFFNVDLYIKKMIAEDSLMGH